MSTCALIPTYNNVGTVADIVRRTLRFLPVIVVADGPTDGSLEAVQAIEDERLVVVSYAPNRGKGYALKQGLMKAKELGYTHVLTLDSDAQHYPEDIPALLRMSAVRPEAIIVGSRGLVHDNMPGKNTFANKFSNFWFALQTFHPLPDTQTGFRIYPLEHLHGLRLMTNRYEAELLLLVFSAWADTPLIPVPIRVYYPPREERVSYFRPAKDFTRISILNTILCVLALVYGLPRRMWRTIYYDLLFLLMVLSINFAALGLFCRYGKDERFARNLRRLVRISCRWFMNRLPGAQYAVRLAKGAKPIDEQQPSIIIANHQSMLDVLSLLSLDDNISMVAKDWVSHNVLFGKLSKAIGMISTEGNGYESLGKIIKEQIDMGKSVVIFPEGTRSMTCEIGRFHKGAFYVAEQLQLPIIPILLRGQGEGLQKKPYHVGHPKMMSVNIMPAVMPDDASWGTNYRERTRAFHKFYYEHVDCNEFPLEQL